MNVICKIIGIIFCLISAFFFLLTFVSGFDFSILMIAILLLVVAICVFKTPSYYMNKRRAQSEASPVTSSDAAKSDVVVNEAVPATSADDIIQYSFYVAGISYREKDVINNLFEENDYYSMTKKELVEIDYTDERIFKYIPSFSSVRLEPDPDNEYDKNAIKVLLDDVHIGFVPKEKTTRVANILKRDPVISCSLYGGPYKIIVEDYDDEKEKEVYSIEKDSTAIGAKVTMKYSKES